eukprot:GHVS01085333.1.p1 GENE.GHVS01085333.1~~GHVS01085333.1.p1  ORF type:complete len:1028 (+),score=146.44 GHVS01085333.1:250-3333(+)
MRRHISVQTSAMFVLFLTLFSHISLGRFLRRSSFSSNHARLAFLQPSLFCSPSSGVCSLPPTIYEHVAAHRFVRPSESNTQPPDHLDRTFSQLFLPPFRSQPSILPRLSAHPPSGSDNAGSTSGGPVQEPVEPKELVEPLGSRGRHSEDDEELAVEEEEAPSEHSPQLAPSPTTAPKTSSLSSLLKAAASQPRSFRVFRSPVRTVTKSQTASATAGFFYPAIELPEPFKDSDISTETKNIPKNYKAPRPYANSPDITVLSITGWSPRLMVDGSDRNKLISFRTPSELKRMEHWEYLMKVAGAKRFVKLNSNDSPRGVRPPHRNGRGRAEKDGQQGSVRHSQSRHDFATRMIRQDATGMWSHLVERGLDSIVDIPSIQQKLEAFRHMPQLRDFYKIVFDTQPPAHFRQPSRLSRHYPVAPYDAVLPHSAVANRTSLLESDFVTDDRVEVAPFGNATFATRLPQWTLDHIDFLKQRVYDVTEHPGGIGLSLSDFHTQGRELNAGDFSYYNYPVGCPVNITDGGLASTAEQLVGATDKKAGVVVVVVDGVVDESLSEGLNDLPDGLFVGSIHSLQDQHYSGPQWPPIDVSVWTNSTAIKPDEIEELSMDKLKSSSGKTDISELYPSMAGSSALSGLTADRRPAPVDVSRLRAEPLPTKANLRRDMFEELHWIPEFSNWGKKNTQPFLRGQIGRLSTKFDNDYPIFDYRKFDFGMAKMSAWNQIGLNDACCISVRHNCTIDTPVHVLQYFTNNNSTSQTSPKLSHPIAHPRLIVKVGNFSSLDLHHTVHGDGGTVNSVSRLVMGEAASLTHSYVQALTNRTWHWENLSVKGGPFSNYTHIGVQAGGLSSRLNAQFETARNCTHNSYSVGFPIFKQGIQRYDMFHVEHADVCVNQLHKFLVGNGGNAVWRCRGRIERTGHRASLNTMSRVVMLGPQSECLVVPALEVMPADTHEANHAAAISGLDLEPLYYFGTRSVSKDVAKLVCMRMFANEVDQHIPDRRIQRLIDRKIMDMRPDPDSDDDEQLLQQQTG